MNFQVSTTENLAIYIWDSLKEKLDKPELLHEVKIYETDKNIIAYRGKTLKRKNKQKTVSISSDSDSDCN